MSSTRYEIRFAVDPVHAAGMGTAELRQRFLIETLFEADRTSLVYSHHDRLVVGGIVPATRDLVLETIPPLGTDSFLARREIIAVNIGTAGAVKVDGQSFEVVTRSMIYIGQGAREVVFSKQDGAQFYVVSAPAHESHPTAVISKADAVALNLGSGATMNERTINRYIHPDGVRTCQLVMGITDLAPGSGWNTIPSHVHDRRSEVYCYFDLDPAHRVLHLMGEPTETRHLIIASEQAVLSPPWSIHSGTGTASYSFIWAMAGDNVDYTDMDPVPLDQMR